MLFRSISKPEQNNILGAIETLNMLKALNPDRTLSSVGKLMVEFPLEPRVSRILVESIMKYPDVLEEIVIAAAFLSTQSPFVLPPGEEMDARAAHHAFRDMQGDFVSYVRLFRRWQSMENQSRFCQNNYLDEKVMKEIYSIKQQLEEEINALGIPVTGGGSMDNYLCCLAAGMIQFVCIREKKENYRSLTADHISIHPGSGMFRTDPLFIVAGEIVRTSRMFAMSVSPLTKALLAKIDPELEHKLQAARGSKGRSLTGNLEYRGSTFREQNRKPGRDDSRFGGRLDKLEKKRSEDKIVSLGGEIFDIEKVKGKKQAVLPYDRFKAAILTEKDNNRIATVGGLKGKLLLKGGSLLEGEKIELIMKIVKNLNLSVIPESEWPRNFNITLCTQEDSKKLIDSLQYVLKVTQAKAKLKQYGFITLFSDNKGTYWFKVSRGFTTALNESLASLESLVDDSTGTLTAPQKEKVNILYRVLNNLYE